MNSLLRDAKGDMSSKRVFGGAVIIMGIIMGFWGAIAGNAILVDYSKWLIGFGTGVLGLGVFEKMRV